MKDPELVPVAADSLAGAWRGSYRYAPGLNHLVHMVSTWRADHPFVLWLAVDGPQVRGQAQERGTLKAGTLTATIEGTWDAAEGILTFVKRYENLGTYPIHYEGRLKDQKLVGTWIIQAGPLRIEGTWQATREF